LTSPAIQSVADNLVSVHHRIDEAVARAGRTDHVSVLAVTKGVPAVMVETAATAGVRCFGENRVQEAQAKIPDVAVSEGELEWHFIGHLQTNKARTAVSFFRMVQSVDSIRLGKTIANAARGLHRSVPVLLEVNTSGESTKFGFLPNSLLDAAGDIAGLGGLEVRGLMTVGPLTSDPEDARAAFRRLRELRDEMAAEHPRILWDTLSMGMSDDYEIAIEEGATMIRLGRAIFGPRH
jgi:hypothetical protein